MDMRNESASAGCLNDRGPNGRAGWFGGKLYLPLDGIASRNRVAFALLFALLPLGGSFFSIVVAFLAGWALVSEALGRFPFHVEPADRLIVGSGVFFFAVITLTDVAHREVLDFDVFTDALARLFFIVPLVLVSRMRVTAHDRILGPSFFGAALGGLILLPIVLFEFFVIGAPRVAAFSGNSGPLSIVATLTAGLSLLHLKTRPTWHGNLLALAGASSASLAVLLSGMRGAWPALLVVLLVAIVARRGVIAEQWKRLQSRRRFTLVVGCVLLVAIAVATAAPAVLHRVEVLGADVALLDTNPFASTSLNRRLEMYSAAEKAFWQRPLFGWGESNMWAAVQPYLDPRVFGTFSYSHLHNVFLTIAIDAGLLGLLALVAVIVAPLVSAWTYRHGAEGSDRLAFAVILVSAFVIPGFTNIMFFHDILDAAWALGVSTLCASLPPGRRAKTQ